MSLLQELLIINESTEKAFVVGKLYISYINDYDEEDGVTVTVVYELKNVAEAEEFVKKCDNAEIDNDKYDDQLYHMAQNGGKGDISSVHGPAYLNDPKIVSKEPKSSKRVFFYKPEDLILSTMG